MKNLKFIIAVILVPFCIAFAEQKATNEFQYQPFPVLLVHGFNAGPETFGVYTYKGDKNHQDKHDNRIMSTLMRADYSDVNFQKDHLAWRLITAFGTSGFDLSSTQGHDDDRVGEIVTGRGLMAAIKFDAGVNQKDL